MTWYFFLGLAFLVLFAAPFYLANKTNGIVVSGGRRRSYLLYVPDSCHPDRPVPLVISIHGFVQWPAHQARLSGWNQLADREGFLVVYPRGTGFPLRWNAQPIVADQERSHEDVRFIEDLVDQISQAYHIDRSRIYVNGMSNGAGMANLLACKLPDRFAAFGGVAGAYFCPEELREDLGHLPWIAFHGLEDPVVPYRGGDADRHGRVLRFPPIEKWTADWAQVGGCRPEPEIEEITTQVSKICYSGCEGGGEVILYRVAGAGHTWPGGGFLPRWLTGKTNREINATDLMWEFFQRYHL